MNPETRRGLEFDKNEFKKVNKGSLLLSPSLVETINNRNTLFGSQINSNNTSFVNQTDPN